MSDNGAAAEDDRSQIKDEGGDDEVRDGPFRYVHCYDVCMRLESGQGCCKTVKEWALIKKLCRKKYQQ